MYRMEEGIFLLCVQLMVSDLVWEIHGPQMMYPHDFSDP